MIHFFAYSQKGMVIAIFSVKSWVWNHEGFRRLRMDRNEKRVFPDASVPQYRPDINVYCPLFYDVVPMQVCAARIKELRAFGGKTCSDCAISLVHEWQASEPAG
jgi:hypothetical protein